MDLTRPVVRSNVPNISAVSDVRTGVLNLWATTRRSVP
jgi:hypothetical protein